MRPTSIINFERFYLGALVVGLINNLLTWNRAQELLSADPNVAAMGSGFQSTLSIASMIFGIGISVLLWYFVARRASNIAKWIVVVLFGLGLIGILMSLSTMMAMGTVAMALSLAAFVMQAYAVYMLFRPDAVAWLTGGAGPTNPDTIS